MLGSLILVAALLFAPGSKERKALEKQLESEFLSQAVVLKLPAAGYIRYYDSNYGEYLHRLVDTELYPNGEVRYLVRMGTAEGKNLLLPNQHVPFHALTGHHPEGTGFFVTKVDVKNDRIELFLNSSGTGDTTVGSYAKLKFMFGDGFENRTDEKGVLLAISQAVRIPRLERLLQAQSEFASLQEELRLRERQYAAASPKTKLPAAVELRRTLSALADNQVTLRSLGESADASGYRNRLTALDSEIQELQRLAVEQHRVELRTQLAALMADATAQRAWINRDPKSGEELNAALEAVAQWRALLVRARDLRSELARAGESGLDFITIERELQAADAQEAALRQQQQKIQIAELDREYAELTRQKNRILDQFLAAGPGEQHAVRQKLLNHLHAMRENRSRAQALGAKTAAAQLDRLDRDIASARSQ